MKKVTHKNKKKDYVYFDIGMVDFVIITIVLAAVLGLTYFVGYSEGQFAAYKEVNTMIELLLMGRS